jgi:hypothetical protein
MNQKAIIERAQGKPVAAFGRTWPPVEQALKEYCIGSGTYQFRLKQGCL